MQQRQLQMLEQMREQAHQHQTSAKQGLRLKQDLADHHAAEEVQQRQQLQGLRREPEQPFPNVAAWRQIQIQDPRQPHGADSWTGWEGQIRSPKPGAEGCWREATVLPELLESNKAMVLKLLAEAEVKDLMLWHEAGHHRPAYEYRVLDNGDGNGITHGGARALLQPFVACQLLPYVREHFSMPDLEVACCLLRRSTPELELRRPVPQDASAYATAVVSLSSCTDFEGGAFIQDAAHADSRVALPLRAGDTLVYRYDTLQGIQVCSGCWWSVVFWFRGMDSRIAPWIQEEATAGDVDAQALLGSNLREGMHGQAQDHASAYHWLALAAARSHPAAQCLLASMFFDGRGVDRSHQLAITWWRKAAGAGHPSSQRLLAQCLLEEPAGDQRLLREALYWLRQAAAQGDCEAMCKLYEIYAEGRRGIPADAELSTSCIIRAAEGGHAVAQNALGLAYASGTMGERSVQDAVMWLGRAANSGALEAQQFLATFFRGSPETWDQAWHWTLQAAKQGDPGAQHNLAMLAFEVAPQHAGVQADALRAIGRAWLRIAAAHRPGTGAAEAEEDSNTDVARCLANVAGEDLDWPLEGGVLSYMQRILADLSHQAARLMRPTDAAAISPSWHLCMDLMSVPHSSDCLFRWGNNKGTTDLPRAYTHDDSCQRPTNRAAVVACEGWDAARHQERRRIAEVAAGALASQGYVVLERLLPEDLVRPLEQEFERLRCQTSGTVSTEKLRAGRTQTAMPFQPPWNEDWLVGHDLVIEVVVRYICNNNALACEAKEDQAWSFIHWVANGAKMEQYMDAPEAQMASPSFGAIDVIYTPPKAMPQLRHRDTNLPGTCASLTVTVPLTPLTPQNGPIAFIPESHKLKNPGMEVVACAPLGSVIIYDSFAAHRGCENVTDRPRSVLSMTFDPGVWMRSFNPAEAGPKAWEHHSAFRRKIGARLLKVQAAVRRQEPWPEPESAGFSCTGRCSAGVACRSCAWRPAEEMHPLQQEQGSGHWYCPACWDHFQHVEWPEREGAASEPGLQPYLGLAGW